MVRRMIDWLERLSLCLGVLVVVGGLAPANVAAQAYPAKAIRLIVGFPPGGGIDFTARVLQQPLQEALGAQVLIDYKPGAGGVLAASELVRAAPDGYTLLVANTGPFAIAPFLQAKRPYDPRKDFTYIGQIAEASYIVVTRPDHPARTLREFVEWARANKDKANFASAGIGSSTHLNGELLNQVAGLTLTHVAYKGSAPAMQDLIGGQTHLLIDAGTVLLPQIRGGKLKALAVTGARRDAALPDVPTVGEQGFTGAQSSGFQGLVGPAGLPPEVVAKLSAALTKVLEMPEVKTKFATAGSEVRARSPQEFAAHVGADADKWAKVIRTGGIKLD